MKKGFSHLPHQRGVLPQKHCTARCNEKLMKTRLPMMFSSRSSISHHFAIHFILLRSMKGSYSTLLLRQLTGNFVIKDMQGIIYISNWLHICARATRTNNIIFCWNFIWIEIVFIRIFNNLRKGGFPIWLHLEDIFVFFFFL